VHKGASNDACLGLKALKFLYINATRRRLQTSDLPDLIPSISARVSFLSIFKQAYCRVAGYKRKWMPACRGIMWRRNDCSRHWPVFVNPDMVSRLDTDRRVRRSLLANVSLYYNYSADL
jgi:hypothetical protein